MRTMANTCTGLGADRGRAVDDGTRTFSGKDSQEVSGSTSQSRKVVFPRANVWRGRAGNKALASASTSRRSSFRTAIACFP